jgi:hypothetical protein
MEESWPMFRPNRWVVERFCSTGKMIQREISRALVLNLSGKAVLGTAQDIFVLDSAFALIEAHPQLFRINVLRQPGLYFPR